MSYALALALLLPALAAGAPASETTPASPEPAATADAPPEARASAGEKAPTLAEKKTPPAPTSRAGTEALPKVALLPFTAGPGVEPEVAKALSEPTAAQIRRIPGVQLITEGEIATLLSYDRQRALLDCQAESCLAEIGGALGAESLAFGTISRLGESWLVTLKLVDVRKARTLAQSDRRLRGGTIDDVLDALPVMVSEIFAPVGAPVPAAVGEERPNLTYIEFLGNGLFTVNYERILAGGGGSVDFGVRVGLGASFVGMLDFSVGGTRHRFEAGVGVTKIFISSPLCATGTLGYRYLSDGNFLLRAGFTPLISTNNKPIASDVTWLPLVGLSTGWVF